jgi:hypothetical protein
VNRHHLLRQIGIHLSRAAGEKTRRAGTYGSLLIRIRADLEARLVDLAKREHRSVNQQIEFLLEQSFSNPAGNLSDAHQKPEGKRRL